MSLHREILEASKEEEKDPEREKNKKEIEGLIKKLEVEAKKPKSKKSYEMSLGEADAALQAERFRDILTLGEGEISDEEFERLQAVLKKFGGKIVMGGKNSKEALVVEFPSNKEKEAKKIKSGLEKKSSKVNISVRKDGNKVFLTMRGK